MASPGTSETVLTVKGLTELHSGEWRCTAVLGDGNTDDKSVTVLVIPAKTKTCPATVSETPRGTYTWGPALGGYTLKQPCQVNLQKLSILKVVPKHSWNYLLNIC